MRWLTKEIDTPIPGNPYVESRRTRVLQYRQLTAKGAWVDGFWKPQEPSKWSEWIDVPTVMEE